MENEVEIFVHCHKIELEKKDFSMWKVKIIGSRKRILSCYKTDSEEAMKKNTI